jgi:hypothetical protein
MNGRLSPVFDPHVSPIGIGGDKRCHTLLADAAPAAPMPAHEFALHELGADRARAPGEMGHGLGAHGQPSVPQKSSLSSQLECPQAHCVMVSILRRTV